MEPENELLLGLSIRAEIEVSGPEPDEEDN
jgi:hypothetical protein